MSPFVCFKNHNQCFYSTRGTQSVRVLIPHNVTEPFQINNEKGNRFVMQGTFIIRLHINGLGQLMLYICKGSCKSVDHLWFIA